MIMRFQRDPSILYEPNCPMHPNEVGYTEKGKWTTHYLEWTNMKVTTCKNTKKCNKKCLNENEYFLVESTISKVDKILINMELLRNKKH